MGLEWSDKVEPDGARDGVKLGRLDVERLWPTFVNSGLLRLVVVKWAKLGTPEDLGLERESN